MEKTSFVYKVQSQMETPKDRENYQKEIEDIKNILQEKYAENPNIEPIVNLWNITIPIIERFARIFTSHNNRIFYKDLAFSASETSRFQIVTLFLCCYTWGNNFLPSHFATPSSLLLCITAVAIFFNSSTAFSTA